MKSKSLWRFRKGSEGNQDVKLECGCIFNCYDEEKIILRVCETHHIRYKELQALGKIMRATDIELKRCK